MSIELVIFDLGRVLIRICDNWQHAAQAAKFTGQLPEMTPTLQAKMHDLVILSETGQIDDATFCERTGQPFNVQTVDVKNMADAYLLGPFAGIDHLITDLKSIGLKTACLSNTNGSHWKLMTAADGPNALPLDKLDFQFASHLVKLRKPEAAIYAHVEQATGIAPGNIVFFDDLKDNIEAAAARGWNAVRITDREDPATQMRLALRGFHLAV